LPKRSLIRVVRTSQGVQVDQTGKLAGRGAYLHDRKSCWDRGLKGPLSYALKTSLTDEERDRLLTFAATLQVSGDQSEDMILSERRADGG
jgi:predicted RNA-binding protein YlxR (DUF448 family)